MKAGEIATEILDAGSQFLARPAVGCNSLFDDTLPLGKFNKFSFRFAMRSFDFTTFCIEPFDFRRRDTQQLLGTFVFGGKRTYR